MKYSYDESNKTLIADGEGHLIIGKGRHGITTSGFADKKDDFKLKVINHHIVGDNYKGRTFRNKIRQSVVSLKYIWLRNKRF